MNTDTGKVYQGEDADHAKARGEILVPISEKAAKTILAGHQALAIQKRKVRMAQRRARERKLAKGARRGRERQKASRRANRRR